MAKGRVFYVPGHDQTQNADLLIDFIQYCWKHPHERFWQALRNWAGISFLLATEASFESRETGDPFHYQDTFYWRGKNG